MDANAVIQVLNWTLSPTKEERQKGEAHMSAFEKTPGFGAILLQIIINGQINDALRLSASITLKRMCHYNWSVPTEKGSLETAVEVPSSNSYFLPDSDKTFIKAHILEALIRTPNKIQTQVGLCFKNIIDRDYPDKWPELVPKLVEYVTSNDLTSTYGALLAVRLILRKYEYATKEKHRKPLLLVVDKLFPIMVQIFAALLNNDALESAQMITVIAKCFWSATNYGIPPLLAEPNVMMQWMTFLLQVLEKPVPAGAPTDPEYAKDYPWYKAKKWTSQIFGRLLTRYGETKTVETPEGKSFSKQFVNQYAPKLLESFLKLLFSTKTGTFVPDRVAHSALNFIDHTIRINPLYKLLKPAVDDLFKQILFPLLCFSEKDWELWQEDPHEFIRKEFDIVEEFYTAKSAAANVIFNLARNRGKNHLDSMMTFVGQSLMRYLSAPTDKQLAREKDGALAIVGELADKLLVAPNYSKQLETIIVAHVIPEFKSSVPWLRSRACWLFGTFFELEWNNPQNFFAGLQGVLACIGDKELPVRMRAILSIQNIIRNDLAEEEIKKILPQLLEEFFKLMNEIDNDELVATLEAVIERFSADMGPYSVTLCQRLTEVFLRLTNTDEELEDDSSMAAAECLYTINTILDAVSEMPQLYPPIEAVLLPLLHRCLDPSKTEFFEEGCKVLSFLTFFGEGISLNMWNLVPFLNQAFEDCIDLMGEIMIPLDNYISKGTDHFLNGGPYLSMVSEMYKKVLMNEGTTDNCVVDACKLVETVLLNCRGKVDQLIEPYCSIALNRLAKAKSPRLRCFLIQVLVNGLYYNPLLTLGIMDKNNWTVQFFSVWFQLVPELPRTHDKKLCVLTWISLLSLPAAHLPPAVQSGFKQILDTSIETSHNLMLHKKKLEEEAEQAAIEEYDDEDGGLNDDEIDENEVEAFDANGHAASSAAHSAGADDDDDDFAHYAGYDDFYDDEEEVYTTPLDAIDEVALILDFVSSLQATNKAMYDGVVANPTLMGFLTALNEKRNQPKPAETKK